MRVTRTNRGQVVSVPTGLLLLPSPSQRAHRPFVSRDLVQLGCAAVKPPLRASHRQAGTTVSIIEPNLSARPIQRRAAVARRALQSWIPSPNGDNLASPIEPIPAAPIRPCFRRGRPCYALLRYVCSLCSLTRTTTFRSPFLICPLGRQYNYTNLTSVILRLTGRGNNAPNRCATPSFGTLSSEVPRLSTGFSSIFRPTNASYCWQFSFPTPMGVPTRVIAEIYCVCGSLRPPLRFVLVSQVSTHSLPKQFARLTPDTATKLPPCAGARADPPGHQP